MIELKRDTLVFSFPEVHPDAKLSVTFQRTLRIPDDGRDYPLPPGLGAFPLRHVDDHAERISEVWKRQGGVLLPMYQSEAMWLSFHSEYLEQHDTPYPFAIKVATGKINAVSGESWENGLSRDPQDYMVSTRQPWLDGYCVEKGLIRQFVAMPLGSGYSVEEQVTGKAEHGGLQITACPMRREVFEERFPRQEITRRFAICAADACSAPASSAAMGLAPGGRMKQEIYRDPYLLTDWDQNQLSRCFVHIANSLTWREITGQAPPTAPVTAKEYERAGLPWFDFYSDSPAVTGAKLLEGVKSVAEFGKQKGDKPLPENVTVEPGTPIQLGPKRRTRVVREGTF